MSKGEELIGVIQSTTDYSKFKRLPGNRELDKYFINELIASFKAHPALRIARPVLVNEDFFIVDGQHSLEASKMLGIPALYMQVEGLDIDDARVLNVLQHSWKLMDYAKSWAEVEKPEYVEFVLTQEEYGVPAATLMRYMSPEGEVQNGISTRFKLGEFDIDDRPRYVDRLEKLASFAMYMPQWRQQSFALAVLTMLKNEDYDHNQMMQKLQVSGLIPHQADRATYLRVLEPIYNRNVSIGHQTRFI